MNTQKFTSIKKFLIVALLSICTFQSFAQNSNGIFFQAVARDNFSNPAKDRNIYVQSTIIQNTTTGTKVLIEIHKSSTDAMGVFNITIGNGQRMGGSATSIAAIDWSKGPFYLNLKIAITPLSASDSWDYTKELVDMGTTSFGAVPFAFYSASSAKVDDKLNATDTTKMLAVYAKAMSVKTLETSLATKLTAADTLTMLAPYAKVAYTIDSNFFRTQLATKLSIADSTKYVTTTQLASYNFSSGAGGSTVDTTNLSNRINLKVNAADITSLTSVVEAKLNIADSTKNYITPTQLASYNFSVGGSGTTIDTLSLSNRINNKASITYVDTQIANISISDADAYTKGKIQLAGDLSGTASAPTIANNSITTSKMVDGAITNIKLASGIDATKVTGDIAGKSSNVNGNVAIINGGTGAATTSGARINLGLVLGTDVEVPLNFTTPLIKNATNISLNQSSVSVDGYLSASDYTSFTNKIDATQKAAINGIASLGNDGKIPSAQIPAISFQSASVINSESAMLALSGLVAGSIAIRTDVNKNFVLSIMPASTLANWIELATPNSVTSINGFAGPNVVLTSEDIAEGTTNKYFTTSRSRATLSASSPLSYNASTGVISMTAASITNNGYLASTDFITFNNKQNTLTTGVDYIAPNSSINAATKTKITYDAKGLILQGTDATTADIAPSTNRNYVTDLQSGVLTNTSGINTGDQTITLTGDVAGTGKGSFATTVNSVGGVSSSTISNFNTRINTNTSSITVNTADIILRATLASPNFTGIPTAPTALAGNNTTQIATTAFVTSSTLAAVPDATSILKGKLKLSNDLGGTADAPTVNTVGGVSSTTISSFDTRISSATSSITANASSINTLNTNVASNTTSITSLITNAVPYTGATKSVNLGAYDLSVNGISIGKGTGTGSASNNVAVGISSLAGTGNYNNAFGSLVLSSNTTGANNNAYGYYALNMNTSGSDNTTMGTTSLYRNTTGGFNIAIGNQSLGNSITGSFNNAIGYQSLYTNSSGFSNVANGYYALYSNSTGSYNTAIGKKALYNNTTGNHNTALGNMANVLNANLENATAIGDSAIVSASNTIQLGNVNVTNVNTSGTITVGAVTYPKVHGTNGQVLSTLGSGTLAWTTTSAPTDASSIAKGIVQLTNDLGGTASLPTVNSVGGVSSSTISSFDTRISSATSSITINSAATNLLNTNVASNTTSITSLITNAVPYTGATKSVNLGAYDLSVNGLTIGKGASSILSNTVVGINALSAITTGAYNNALGSNSLSYNQSGNNNNAFGYFALNKNTGSENTAIGTSTLYNNTSGNNNTAVGSVALLSNTIGYYNTAIGHASLYYNTTGYFNTTSGYMSMYNNTSGYYNIANGYYSLYSNSTGWHNTAIGKAALSNNTTGNHNTALGNMANVGNVNLENATAIGDSAIVSASNTIQLGNVNVTNVNTSGTITAGVVTYPKAHGTNGQVLSTLGSGTLTWTTAYTLPTASALNLGGVKVGTNLSIDGSGVLSANINAASISGTISLANGGTGATTAAASLTNLGAAPIASPIFTGTPSLPTGTTAITQTAGNNTTALATTAFVTTAVAAAVRLNSDEFNATAGQTSFTLSQTPLGAKVWMFVNGTRIKNGAYSVSGTTITYTPSNNNSFTLVLNDRIQFDYAY